MQGHTLKIISLRDIQAECDCKRWNFLAPAFDRDSDQTIKKRIAEAHAIHVNNERRAFACSRCGAAAGKPCKNYKGQNKQTCPKRGDAAESAPASTGGLFNA